MHRVQKLVVSDDLGRYVITDCINLEELLLAHKEVCGLGHSQDRRQRHEYNEILKTCAALSFVKHYSSAVY